MNAPTIDLVTPVRARLAKLSPPLAEDEAIVVGVSGGVDSLALLHVLTHGAVDGPGRVVAAHLDHGWRLSGADEAAFVAETAAAWGARCAVARVDTRAADLSSEEAAREARYAFLARVARTAASSVILTAHHADDQAETILMHLLRGAGPAGLRGMTPVGPLPGGETTGLRLVRPWLGVRRADIVSYAMDHGLQPVEDPSNRDTTHFRNRLRHELLPYLADYNPQIVERLRHTADVVAADYALLEDLVAAAWRRQLTAEGDGWLRLDLAGWRAAPLSIRRAILRRAVWRLMRDLRDVPFRPLEKARRLAERGTTGQMASLPGAVTLTIDYETLLLTRPGAGPPADAPQLLSATAAALPVPGEVALADGRRLAARLAAPGERPTPGDREHPWRQLVDLTGAVELRVRARRPGDRLQPLGLDGRSTKMADLMINRKIPAALRDRWPLVVATQADGRETPVWLCGHVVDYRWRVTAETRQPVLLMITPGGEGA